MVLDHFTGKLFLFSLSFIVTSFSVDLKFNFLPINGLILISYVLFIFCITLWVTSKLIQKILAQNKPIIYDFDKNWFLKYTKTGFVYLQSENLLKKREDNKEILKDFKLKNIDERIDDFTGDVEILIKKWFVFISGDETFLGETKNLVDEILRRFLQVLVDVDGKKLLHGVLVIFLSHVKEYQKAVRRQKKKYGSIEELYRYSHIASNNTKAFEHIISQLTSKLIRQFISWEVFNSVPCKTVTSILSKKLTAHVLVNLSSPSFINYKLASISVSQSKKKLSFNLEKYDAISLIDVDHEGDFKQPKIVLEESKTHQDNIINEEINKNAISKSNTPKVSPKKLTEMTLDLIDQVEEEKIEIDEIDSNKTISSPVKIYESKSCEKTWRNSSDLECISLGQDLLVDFNDPESEITDLIAKKLWKDSEEIDETKREKDDEKIDQISNFITGNVTSTLQELQQTTVNNVVKPVTQVTSSAMHKIGDLQDEAAGVMEGIFDFGMAGLRKGLRLTGLQEGSELRSDFGRIKPVLMENLNEIKEKGRKLSRVGPVLSEDLKSEKSLEEDAVWMNPLIKDSPNFDGQILLEKQPPILSVSQEDEFSPDLEYEDTTDLATTTAKLRSLLQQKQTESTLTTPALSPMPIDETGRSLSTISNSSFEDLTNVDGALPSLYKFCARTATGVFQNTLNTLKTALPGNQNALDQENEFISIENVNHWTYVASDLNENDLSIKMEKLLSERRAFCTVDNAYEAVESLDVLDQTSGWSSTKKYDDDIDDLELNIPLTKTLLDIFCESSPSLLPEALIKSILILFGSVIEEYLVDYSKKSLKSVNGMIGNLPGGLQMNPLALTKKELTEIFVELIPGGLKYLVGEDLFRSAIETLILSLQSQKINEDVMLQIFELITSLVIEANCSLSPTYSA